MKLLVIIASYPPHQIGGYEIRCKDVLDGLRKKGHDILVITTKCPDKNCNLHSGEKNIFRVLDQRIKHSNNLSQIISDYRDIEFVDKKTTEFQPDIIYLWAIQSLSNAIFPYFSHKDIQIVYDEGGAGLIYLEKIRKRGIYFYKNDADIFIKKRLKNIIYSLIKMLSFNLIKPSWSWPPNLRLYFNSHSSLR